MGQLQCKQMLFQMMVFQMILQCKQTQEIIGDVLRRLRMIESK